MAGSLYERYRDALRRGHEAARAGGHAEAVAAYGEAAVLLPDRAAPHVGLGHVEAALGRHREALHAFEAALARDPADHAAARGRDRARAAMGAEAPPPGRDEARPRDLTTTGDPGETGDAVTEAPEVRALALEVDRAAGAGDVAALLAAGRRLADAGRPDAAIDACVEALSIAPGDPAVHRELARIYDRHGWDGRADRTRRLVERLLDVRDDVEELDRRAAVAERARDVDALLEIALRHAERGRIGAGLEAAVTALVQAPGDARVHLAIARIQLGDGRRDRAEATVADLARWIELTGDEAAAARLARFRADELGRAGGAAASA